MLVSLALIASMARICAPGVAPTTLAAIVQVESGGDPLTIGLNTHPHRGLHPASLSAAEAVARALRAAGADFDLGLTQINVRNLGRLGLSLRDALQACPNLQGGARILSGAYRTARARQGGGQAALVAALSAYNTGDARRGVRNGYVAKVFRAAGGPPRRAPPLRPTDGPAAPPVGETTPLQTAASDTVDVFAPCRPRPSVWTPTPPPPVRLTGAIL